MAIIFSCKDEFNLKQENDEFCHFCVNFLCVFLKQRSKKRNNFLESILKNFIFYRQILQALQ